MFKIEWTKRHTVILLYTCATLVIAALVFYLIVNPSVPLGFISSLLSALRPVFIGFAAAYLLYPVCRLFDAKVFARLRHQRARRILSVLASFLLFAALIALFVSVLVPQVTQSYKDLTEKFDDYIAQADAALRSILGGADEGQSPLQTLLDARTAGGMDLVSLPDRIADRISAFFDLTALSGLFNAALATSAHLAALLSTTVLSFLFAVFFLLEKERLFALAAHLFSAVLPAGVYARAHHLIEITDRSVGGFILGKLLDSFIILIINMVVFTLFRMPYAPLVALVCGITNLIPYFGPIIGGVPCGFIILIADPGKVILFIVLTFVIQQIDGNLIGPKVLGDRVGIDSLLIITSISVCGSLWGLVGMLIGVPLFAVLYRVSKEIVERRLAEKELPTETSAYIRKGATQK
ncbi:MAG: AI-2E family transporter [Clostridia bacterium]|nr:AI-2E family transporter [Clostridia bacterium]